MSVPPMISIRVKQQLNPTLINYIKSNNAHGHACHLLSDVTYVENLSIKFHQSLQILAINGLINRLD